jgi:arylsulfatase A-like enzyme
MQESVYRRRVEPRRLPDDAPNILVVLIDDAGPGLPTTFGGEFSHADDGPHQQACRSSFLRLS